MRRVTVTTEHADAARARAIAASVRPDNTDEMDTRVADDRIRTTIERETTGGLQATVDDYVVNLTVAARVAGNVPGDRARDATVGLTSEPDAQTDRKTDEHANTNTDT